MPATVQKEKVTDTAVLRSVSSVMEMATGAGRVFNVTLSSDDVFRGNAAIPGGAIGGGALYLAFKFDPNEGTIGYVQARLSTDSIDALDIDRQDSPTGRQRRLRCNTGNVQCGGKCQNAAKNCFAYMSPAQKKEAMRALRLARRSGTPAPSYSMRERLPMGPVTAPPNARIQAKGRSLPEGVTKTESSRLVQYSFKVGNNSYKVEFGRTADDVEMVVFKRDGFLSVGRGQQSTEETAIAAVKISRIFKAHASGLPDGSKLTCSAHTNDGKGLYRAVAYEKAGFTRPMMADRGMSQFARVENGQIVADRDRLLRLEASYGDSDKADKKWKRSVSSLKGQRKKERAERSRSDKADREPITDRIVLGHLLDSIGSATGATQLINVTKEGDIFRGNAIIPGGAVGGGPLYLAFKANPTIGGMAYREAAIAQDSAAAIRVDAPTVGRELKCKAGNVQCGGKCQGAKQNCFAGMTPEQKRSATKALKAAGRSGSAPATPEPKIEAPKSKTKKAQPPTPKGEGPQMPKGVKVKETQKRTDYTFKVGADRYDITFFHRDDGGSTVAFTTNGRMWGTDGQSTRDAAIAAVKINRVVKAHVAKLPDGHKLDASAFKGDEKEAYRSYAYARFGFTRPEFGEPGMEQFGKVSRGKIVPDKKRLRDSENEEDRKEYDRDWKKALKDLEKDRSRSRQSARAAA